MALVDGAADRYGGHDFGRFVDPVIDENLDIIRTVADPEARREATETIDRRFGEQVYNLWLTYTLWGIISQPYVNGVEANVLLSRDLLKWEQFKDLHRETYRAVKKVHKALPVFFTTDVLHYKRLARDARGSQQEKEVMDLMRFSDLFAMSVYPHMSADVSRPVPANFLDFATRFKRPVAVAESGMSAQDIELRSYATQLRGSEADQKLLKLLIGDRRRRRRSHRRGRA